jgi:ATP-binding protein involved in chromosome partitioning
MGEMLAGSGVAVESKLEDTHAGKPELISQVRHLASHRSEVFRDNRNFTQCFQGLPEKVAARTPHPAAADGSAGAGRNLPVPYETDEVIQTDRIEALQHRAQTVHPPVVATAAQSRPAVEWIAPQLPGGAEVIRWYAGHRPGTACGIEIEDFPVSPDVRALVRHEDGYVSHEPYTHFPAAILKLSPLAVELVLEKDVIVDLISQLTACGVERTAAPATQRRGPLVPGTVTLRGCESAVEGVILEPFPVRFPESLDLSPAARGFGLVSLEGQSKRRLLETMGGGIVDASISDRGMGGQLPAAQQSVASQELEAQKQRFTGEGRERQVGRVGRSHGTCGKHLPPALSRPCQIGGEAVSLGSQISDAMAARQRGGVEQNPAGADIKRRFSIHLLSLIVSPEEWQKRVLPGAGNYHFPSDASIFGMVEIASGIIAFCAARPMIGLPTQHRRCFPCASVGWLGQDRSEIVAVPLEKVPPPKMEERREPLSVTEKDVLDALRHIQDPDLNKDIVSLGFVRNIRIDGSRIRLDINLTTPACPVKDLFKTQARDALMALPGVDAAEVSMTAEVRKSSAPDKKAIEGVKHIIAIGSGKGGVGKSTVAVNLAVALSQTGARVGLLDADIYGPTIPIMMGTKGPLETRGEVIIPRQAHGIALMSMGYMAPGDQPLIWRGPMAHQALQQALLGVDWGERDYLLVDLPPGTGDVHLTLVQSTPLTGGVIVTTPQDVGLTISRKTLRMLQQTRVPILGLVENMSYYVCPHCGERDDIFGHGGAEIASRELDIPFLGEIPLEKKIREYSDLGTPVVVSEPESEIAKTYREIAGRLAQQVSIRSFDSPAISLVEE